MKSKWIHITPNGEDYYTISEISLIPAYDKVTEYNILGYLMNDPDQPVDELDLCYSLKLLDEDSKRILFDLEKKGLIVRYGSGRQRVFTDGGKIS